MQAIDCRRHATEVLLKLSKIPEVFTIEMYDGTMYTATLADTPYIWSGFEHLPMTTLNTPRGPIEIDLFEVKDIY